MALISSPRRWRLPRLQRFSKHKPAASLRHHGVSWSFAKRGIRRRHRDRRRKFRSQPTMGFMDLRQWMALLEKEGELRRITAEVDWDREIGAIARRVLEKKIGR